MVVPAIGETGTVIAWAGGLWDWLDPVAAIEAMALLEAARAEDHLVFFAGPHPSGDRLASSTAARARATAVRLGLTGHRVSFIEDHLPLAE